VKETVRPVQSSNIAEYAWDDDSEDLEVAFKSGDAGIYRNVPRSVFRALQNSQSAGSALHRLVIGRYQYERL
jgi:hypothetical protein